jgi:FAD/FMN-containing dehydrogenase
MSAIDALLPLIEGIRTETHPKAVRAKSRDFYWYSPVLKRKLEHVIADLIVCPVSEAEVLRTLKACHELAIPVTPRGAGTGNYGQAMPLAGGVVMDLRGLDAIREIKDGSVVCGAGALIGDLDAACRAQGQEIRLHPSTKETATIGGFIAGGSGGVGSMRWGVLRDPGNILAVRVATMEAEPKIVTLTGRDVMQVHHAYGVNGIITEVEFGLAPAVDWVEMLIAGPDWLAINDLADRIAHMDGLWLKQLATVQAPAPQTYFLRHRKFLEAGESIIVAMAAPNAVGWLDTLAGEIGARIAYRSDQASAEDLKAMPHAHHLCWNHTTLRALRVEPEITYLQVGFPNPGRHDKLRQIAEAFSTHEVMGHNEFFRGDGKVTCAGLTLVRFTTEERLWEIVAAHEAIGCASFSPHHYTVEEGGMKTTDPLHLDVKRRHDPKGLLNPGKMIGWEDASFDYAEHYAYPGMMQPKADVVSPAADVAPPKAADAAPPKAADVEGAA